MKKLRLPSLVHVGLLFILGIFYSSPRATTIMAQMMVGGYDSVPSTDPSVVEAAKFAFGEFWTMKPSQYSIFSSSEAAMTTPASTATFDIIKASQQVVAGMNYDLTLMLLLNDECQGGFRVIVYDQFGSLSVTEWGEEYTPDEAETMMKEMTSKNNVDVEDQLDAGSESSEDSI